MTTRVFRRAAPSEGGCGGGPHHAGAAADGAALHLAARLVTFAVAALAGGVDGDGELLVDALGGLGEGQLHGVLRSNRERMAASSERAQERRRLFVRSNLLRLIKDGVEIAKAPASRVFPKDLPEELLWVNVAGLSAPVLLPSPGLARLKARSAVRVVLLPLALVTQDLREGWSTST